MHAWHVVTGKDTQPFVRMLLGGEVAYGVKTSHAVAVIGREVHALGEIMILYPNQKDEQ